MFRWYTRDIRLYTGAKTDRGVLVLNPGLDGGEQRVFMFGPPLGQTESMQLLRDTVDALQYDVWGKEDEIADQGRRLGEEFGAKEKLHYKLRDAEKATDKAVLEADDLRLRVAGLPEELVASTKERHKAVLRYERAEAQLKRLRKTAKLAKR